LQLVVEAQTSQLALVHAFSQLLLISAKPTAQILQVVASSQARQLATTERQAGWHILPPVTFVAFVELVELTPGV
jgi:hypothetical protein